MSRPPHPPRLYNSNYTWRRVQIMQLPVMQLSPPSRRPSLLGPNILLSTLFSNTLSLCSSLTVRQQEEATEENSNRQQWFYSWLLSAFQRQNGWLIAQTLDHGSLCIWDARGKKRNANDIKQIITDLQSSRRWKPVLKPRNINCLHKCANCVQYFDT
jgi:hypothetical protein